jgi:hypothetical protein
VYEIWHDNDFDLAHWLYLNTQLKNEAVVLRQIPKTNSPSDLLNHLKTKSDLAILPSIKYETPDIILIQNDGVNKPRIELVIEFMTHTPQHDHPLQRFTRIYGSAWLGIPSLLVIPQQKEKLERGKKEFYKPVMYKANPLIYHLFIKTFKITKTPTLLLMWPEKNGYLKYDKFHPTAPKIEGDIKLLIEIIDNILIKKEIFTLSNLHTQKQVELSNYKEINNPYALTSGSVMQTKLLIDKYGKLFSKEIITKLLLNSETFFYSPKGLKSGSSQFRTDPYAGKVCAFDIIFCRNAEGERVRNLVLQANKVNYRTNSTPTLISADHDRENCPFIVSENLEATIKHFENFCPYTERKQQRIYGEVLDLIIFEDKEIYVPRY